MSRERFDYHFPSSWADAGWRVLFNKLGNFNWLGTVRKTKLYHNTEDVINR